jgi:hypothetical protein
LPLASPSYVSPNRVIITMCINHNGIIMHKPRINLLNALLGNEVPQTVRMHRQRKLLKYYFKRKANTALGHSPTNRVYIALEPRGDFLSFCHLCLPQIDEQVCHDVINRPLTLHRLLRKPDEPPSSLK